MKRQVLFIHGGGQGAFEADKELAANLRDELGAAYHVRCPEIPDEESPEYEAWKEEIEQELAALDGEVILVGHSLGALFLLKYVSEEEVEKPVVGLFLVATPYVGTGGWEFEEDALREDFAAEIHLRIPVFLYHSHDDEVVPFAHLALYEAKLPQATINELEGRGHQFDNDLSEVARDIKSL
jgi:predicted alpha/beta hydrolase family esterase